jgi:hypothetical protein
MLYTTVWSPWTHTWSTWNTVIDTRITIVTIKTPEIIIIIIYYILWLPWLDFKNRICVYTNSKNVNTWSILYFLLEHCNADIFFSEISLYILQYAFFPSKSISNGSICFQILLQYKFSVYTISVYTNSKNVNTWNILYFLLEHCTENFIGIITYTI